MTLKHANRAVHVMAVTSTVLAVSTYNAHQFDELIERFSLFLFVLAAMSCVVAARYPTGWRTGRIAAVMVPVAFVSRGLVNLSVPPPGVDNWNITIRVTLWLYAAWISWSALTRWIIPVRDLSSVGVHIEEATT